MSKPSSASVALATYDPPCKSISIGPASKPSDLPSPVVCFKSRLKVLSTPGSSCTLRSSPAASRRATSTAAASCVPLYVPGGMSMEIGPLSSTSTNKKSFPQKVPVLEDGTTVFIAS